MKLHRTVISQLKFSLGDGPVLEVADLSASPALQRFVLEQGRIGWYNLLCGFVSSSLAKYMDRHLPDEANCDGPEWVIRFLRLVQSWVADCWHTRCNFEHRKTKENESTTRLNLLSRIEQVYAVKHQVPISFRQCFKYSLKYFTDKSDSFLVNWLTLYEKLILDAAQDPKRQQTITEFFPFAQSF